MLRNALKASWPFLAAALFFAAVLAYGIAVGELTLPGKGHMLRTRYSEEPILFGCVAMFYLALIGLAGWVPWLCIQDARGKLGCDGADLRPPASTPPDERHGS